MALNRGVQVVWDNESTGSNGHSKFAVVGAQSNVCVHLTVSGATTIGFECAPSDGSVGFNTLPTDADARTLYKKDGTGPLTITLATAGTATVDLSPFIPKFIRVTSTNSVTATAVVEVLG